MMTIDTLWQDALHKDWLYGRAKKLAEEENAQWARLAAREAEIEKELAWAKWALEVENA